MQTNSMDFAAVLLVFVVAIIPLTGAMIASTPYLMRRGEVFAVTLPDIAADDPYVSTRKRRYVVFMLLATAALTACGVAGAVTGEVVVVLVAVCGGSLVLCAGGYALMLYYRAQVRAYKQARGWRAAAQESVALVDDVPLPHAISLKWNLLYLPLVAVTLIMGMVGYAHMPEMIPQHINLQGDVTDYMQKTPATIGLPVLIVLFLAGCMMFSHWTIVRSKKPVNPSAPITSALAYGMFARAQSIVLVVGGLALCLLGPLMQLSFMGLLDLKLVAVVIMLLALIFAGGSLAVGVVYGQGGARLFAQMDASGVLRADEDTHWKLGVFYYSPADPSLFLPERFGVGWTINWARPAVWVMMGGGVVVTVAFVVAILMIV